MREDREAAAVNGKGKGGGTGGCQVYVGNLNWKTTQEEIGRYFSTYGEVVDVYLSLPRQDHHSIHLHGYKFWVVETGWTGLDSAAKRYDDTDTFEGQPGFQVPIATNYVDPPYVDTFTMTEFSYARLRIIADNPGMWHFHCHLLIHMQQGLQMVFNVGEAQQPDHAQAEGRRHG